ncbi:hypothetical protein O9993_19660 [Vibrio lentus]|nr:hypothetical protein [Vibrio lentus]
MACKCALNSVCATDAKEASECINKNMTLDKIGREIAIGTPTNMKAITIKNRNNIAKD